MLAESAIGIQEQRVGRRSLATRCGFWSLFLETDSGLTTLISSYSCLGASRAWSLVKLVSLTRVAAAAAAKIHLLSLSFSRLIFTSRNRTPCKVNKEKNKKKKKSVQFSANKFTDDYFCIWHHHYILKYILLLSSVSWLSPAQFLQKEMRALNASKRRVVFFSHKWNLIKIKMYFNNCTSYCREFRRVQVNIWLTCALAQVRLCTRVFQVYLYRKREREKKHCCCQKFCWIFSCHSVHTLSLQYTTLVTLYSAKKSKGLKNRKLLNRHLNK